MDMRIVILALLPATALALDLNPQPASRELEGVRIPMVAFKDTKGEVQWTPPSNWRMNFENGALTLKVPDRSFSRMEMRVVAKNAGDLSLLSKTETIPQFCASFLPSTAKNAVYKSTSEGAYTIGPIPAREYILDYEDEGRQMQASVSIVEYSAQQRFVVVVTAPTKDFTATRDEAIQSLFSWRGE